MDLNYLRSLLVMAGLVVKLKLEVLELEVILFTLIVGAKLSLL